MTKVFISHSTADKSFARRLCSELERYGVEVWFDEKEILVGDSLREKIELGLTEADFVVIVLSPSAIKRPWVLEELKAAYSLEMERRTKVIIPVLIKRTTLPLFLKDKRYADFRGDFDSAFHELLRALDVSPSTNLRLETLSCTVTIDIRHADGNLAYYQKNQVIRCRQATADCYTECFTSDGTISGFEVAPGQIQEQWLESGVRYVRTSFPSPMRENETLDRTFKCTWHNSFNKDREYWEEKQTQPSKDVEVLVIFPSTRPPKDWRAEEREGTTLRPSNADTARLAIRGRPALRLFVPQPKFLVNYILRWSW